ncbi:MAG TPA: CBS domain-containing protein [Bacteroidales bacterium]|nr:CBS domain-containing protein [Bacteroidales bacterium]HPI69641.1 CBS domain-containing protein [Bacteroidales bacterium]
MKVLTAKDIMSRDVLEVKSDWSLQRLAEFLVENCISGAPVISEDGKLVGVVSLTDMISHDTMLEKDPETDGHHEYYIHTLENQLAPLEIESLHFGNEPLMTVGNIMTPKIYSVNEDTPVQKVADTMISNHIHRIFVTREGKVLGIISAADMLKIIRDM